MSEIPDFFHALTAWRKFDTTHGNRVLTSAGMTQHWWTTADLGEAICHASNIEVMQHDAPQLTCTCGFYCYKERADAEQHAQGTILAKVEIWGRLAEHKRGYRAQHMKILELYVAPGFSAIDALTKCYGVAVLIDEGASKWISESQYALSSLNQSQNPYGWQSLPYLPYNPSLSLNPPILGHQLGSMSAHAIAALQQYQNQSALNIYNTQYQTQLQNYVTSQAIQAIQRLALIPKAPYILLANATTVGAVGSTITVECWYDDIDEQVAVTQAPVETDDSEQEPPFDPVADRVNTRLQETA